MLILKQGPSASRRSRLLYSVLVVEENMQDDGREGNRKYLVRDPVSVHLNCLRVTSQAHPFYQPSTGLYHEDV